MLAPLPNDMTNAGSTQGLRLPIFVVALLPLLTAMSLFGLYFVHRSITQAEDALISRGQEMVRRVAQNLAFDWLAGNLPAARRMLVVEHDGSQAVAMGLRDGASWQVIAGDVTQLPQLDGVSLAPLPPLHRQGRLLIFAEPIRPPSRTQDDPYLAGAEAPGAMRSEVVIVLSRVPVELARSQAVLAALSMALVSMTLALLLGWRLAGRISRPIDAITRTVRSLAQGEWSKRVDIHAPGELGQLQDNINRMAEALEASQGALELRVQEATAELRGQKLAAESATAAKSRFLAAASHDLRQPLHALALLVEALLDKTPPGEARRLAEHISVSAHAMEGLLNALLDLSRLDAGAVVARPECFPLARVMENLERQFSPLAADRGLRLTLHAGKIWLYTDAALLERILANLISNALRYTDTGGVVVGARRVQKDWVRIEVHDSGRGIAQEFQTRVFEEYFQVANPERHRDKGLGLGLAIVSRLAKLLGSPVDLRSSPGRGSSFSLRFARCHARRVEEAPTSAPGTLLSLPLEDALVVFIDDDESILEAMLEVFDQWGVAVAAGENAEDVLQDLRDLGRAPDLIISDYRLKDSRTGIEAVAAVRAAFGPIPAALLTGDTSAESLRAISESGLPVLHKPLKPAKLRAFLTHLLASQTQTGAQVSSTSPPTP